MTVTVFPSVIEGTISPPPSKSAMQRACALALLHHGRTIVSNPGASSDDLVAVKLLADMGAETTYDSGNLVVQSNGIPEPKKFLFMGESGLSARMFTPIAAISGAEICITGEGSLLRRPMHFFDEVLPQLGIRCRSESGYLPLTLQGPMVPADIHIDGSRSSQYLTGLLYSMASCAKYRISLTVDNLVSRPYIDLSMSLMRHFGWKVEAEGYRLFHLLPGNELLNRDIHYRVEGDWSQAAVLLVAGLLSGRALTVTGIDLKSVQADRMILRALEQAGALFLVSADAVTIRRSDILRPFRFDATQSPDLFPPLVAMAAACKGLSVIRGVSRLADKESNRSEALMQVYADLGVNIKIAGDDLLIEGNERIRSATVHAFNDHRIAMSIALSGLRAEGPVTITGAASVKKSWPAFFDNLSSLGANIERRDK